MSTPSASAVERAAALTHFLDVTVRSWLVSLDINTHAACDSAACSHARVYGECYDALEEILSATTSVVILDAAPATVAAGSPALPAEVEAALRAWKRRCDAAVYDTESVPLSLSESERADLLATVTALVAAERERCAQIASDLRHRPYEIAKQIRQAPRPLMVRDP